MNFPAITGTQFFVGMIVLIALIVGIILFLRSRFSTAGKGLSDKYKDKPRKSPLEARTKYPEVDAFRFSGPLLNFGLVAALLFVILAFNYTSYEKAIDVSDYLGLLEEEEIEMEPPRTAEPPPPPPPPPPPVIEEVPEELIEEEDEPVFEDMDIDAEEEVEPLPEPVREEAPPPPPPPPPPPKSKAPEIFKVVEDMPRFPGCENKKDKEERKQCSQKKMLEFIYKNIKYPPIARENGIEGTAVINFVVDEKGNIKDPKIVRDVSGGCGQEALRVVKMMNGMSKKWIPGKQRGKPVNVYFNLPVRFKLE